MQPLLRPEVPRDQQPASQSGVPGGDDATPEAPTGEPNDPGPIDTQPIQSADGPKSTITQSTNPDLHSEGKLTMSQLDQAINDLLSIEGATGAAIVDLSSGMALAQAGNPGFSLEVAAAGNSNVVRAKMNTMRDLGVTDEIDDILITLGQQYHLINVLKDEATQGLFIYLVLNRNTANLALARHKLNAVARKVRI